MTTLTTLLYLIGLIVSTTQSSHYNNCGTLCQTCNSKTYDCTSCVQGAVPISAAACTCQENWIQIETEPDQCVEKGSVGYYVYISVGLILILVVIGLILWGLFALFKCIQKKTGYSVSDWIWKRRMLGRSLAPIQVDVPRKIDNQKQEISVERDSVISDKTRGNNTIRENLEVELIGKDR